MRELLSSRVSLSSVYRGEVVRRHAESSTRGNKSEVVVGRFLILGGDAEGEK